MNGESRAVADDVCATQRVQPRRERTDDAEHLQRLAEHVGAWLYVIAGFLAFAEAATMTGLGYPGETALLVAGPAAHRSWISPGPMLAVAIVAAVAGDSVGYELGRHYRPALRVTRLGRHVGPARWASADGFLHRHGGKAIPLGRFTALPRALTPGLAGMARNPHLRTFLPWNIAGGILCGAGTDSSATASPPRCPPRTATSHTPRYCSTRPSSQPDSR